MQFNDQHSNQNTLVVLLISPHIACTVYNVPCRYGHR